VRAGLNSAVYDSVMVAFAKHLDNVPADLKERYAALKRNADFLKFTSSHTTDVETIRDRFALAEKVLFEDVSNETG
jgi:hypothetical protein